MKKLNKVLAILCTSAIALGGVAAMSACGGGPEENPPPQHKHEDHLTYVIDGDKHYQKCSEDDYTTSKVDHVWGADDKCVCGAEKPAAPVLSVTLSDTVAVLEDAGEMATYKVTATTEAASITADTADHAVATAAVNGKEVTVTAVHTGKTELTVSIDGASAKCSVEVATAGLSYGSVQIQVGDEENPEMKTIIQVSDGEDRTSQDIYIPGYWVDEDDGVLLPVYQVAEAGFKNKKNIISVYLGDNLEVVSTNGFEVCTNLATVTCGPKLRSIGGGAFGSGGDSMALHTFDLSRTTGLTEIGACAFRFTQFTEFTIPATVTAINYGMFQGCAQLTTVKFLGEVSVIFNDMFLNSTNLREVWIPKSVTEIQKWAFGSYSGMPSEGVALVVKYEGTQEEWNAINIVDNLNDPIIASKNPQLQVQYGIDFNA